MGSGTTWVVGDGVWLVTAREGEGEREIEREREEGEGRRGKERRERETEGEMEGEREGGKRKTSHELLLFTPHLIQFNNKPTAYYVYTCTCIYLYLYMCVCDEVTEWEG